MPTRVKHPIDATLLGFVAVFAIARVIVPNTLAYNTQAAMTKKGVL